MVEDGSSELIVPRSDQASGTIARVKAYSDINEAGDKRKRQQDRNKDTAQTHQMGQKRPRSDTMDATEENQSPFLPMFETFRAELDEHHDRRERIIKASRDVTAASKKM